MNKSDKVDQVKKGGEGEKRWQETGFGSSEARMAVLMAILIIAQDGLASRNKDGLMSMPNSPSFALEIF